MQRVAVELSYRTGLAHIAYQSQTAHAESWIVQVAKTKDIYGDISEIVPREWERVIKILFAARITNWKIYSADAREAISCKLKPAAYAHKSVWLIS